MVSVVVDGNHCLHMVMHVDSYDVLSVRGSKTGGVFGALKVIRRVIDLFKATDCYVAWDGGSSRYRLRIYPDYKKHRLLVATKEEKEEKEEYTGSFFKQKALIIRVLKSLGVRSFEFEGVEGDDVIYLLAKILRPGVVVVTEDTDMAQMVRKGVDWYRPRLDKTVTTKNFSESFSVPPIDIPIFKSLVGDVSDNINGVRGVGKKTAEKALVGFNKKFGKHAMREISKFFAYCGRDPASRVNKIAGSRDIVSRNLSLIDLSRFVWSKEEVIDEVSKGVERKVRIDPSFVRRVFTSLQFDSLLENFSVWVQPFKLLRSSR